MTTDVHPVSLAGASDTAATDAFVERLFGSILGALDLQAVYLGDRLGYYRALATGPLTSTELATRTGTAERYAREWLEQQAVTGILVTDDRVVDALARRYALPAPHVGPLTDALDPSHFAPFVQFVVGCLKQTELMANAFRTRRRRGLGRARADAREAQAVANRPLFLRPLGREYLPSIPDVDPALRAGGRVADVGCGLRLVVDRCRPGLPGRHGRRLRRRRAVDRGGAAQRPRGGRRRPGPVPHAATPPTVDAGARTTSSWPWSASTTWPTRSGCWRPCGGWPVRAAPSW